LKQHQERLRRLPALAEQAVEQALFAGAEYIANEAALSITRGAVSGKNHVASAPGQPPNADTHRLDRSIEGAKAGRLKAKVSANSGYASALEFGTSKMAARPFMRPARDKSKEHVRDLVARGMNEALRRSRAAGV
jgi:HK97 gp10 family phage protein